MSKSIKAKHARSRGFTVLEVIVAIGAVAVVTAGLATVFQSVGKAVSGGQRVSSLSQYAASVEQQMRRDFARMTRDGFLVIRNQRVGNQACALYKGDPAPRARRVDELVFFGKGEFKSLRDAMNPYVSASSNEARIYYGHGAKPEYSIARSFADYEKIAKPDLWTRNSPLQDSHRLGDNLTGNVNGLSIKPYSNAYASEWILLRQVTLLMAPETTRTSLPTIGWGNVTPYSIANLSSKAADKDCQIALRPAVSSIFMQAAALGPTEDVDGASAQYLRPIKSATDYPKFSSGLIDIATTSLAEIRAMVNFNPKFPADVSATDVPLPIGPDLSFQGGDSGHSDRMHAWMANALPTNSDQHNLTGSKISGNSGLSGVAVDPNAGQRIRCEAVPPDELGILSDTSLQGKPEEMQYRLADQRMLSASNFVPRCSEFMVEWTYGLRDSSDINRDGDYNEFEWYGADVKGTATAAVPQMTVYNGNYPLFVRSVGNPYKLPSTSVYGSQAQDPTKIVTACFGYVEPAYAPQSATEPVSLPMAWPKAIRVTMRIADSNDPSQEETFSFVFSVPGADPVY